MGVAIATSGCTAIATTVASVGAGIGANHFFGSVNYRTFTETPETVLGATTVALRRMHLERLSVVPIEGGKIIRARSLDRTIEIGLEVVTPAVTRMRSVVRIDNSILLDPATAAEIVAQTERVLANSARTAEPAPPQAGQPHQP
jgi:hypothetical protein